MRNLEEMRKKFEREYALAELENQIESSHPELTEAGIEIRMFEPIKKGDSRWCVFHKAKVLEEMTEKDACMLLSIFPSDSKFPVYHGQAREYNDEYYDMRLSRNPRQQYTMLEIRWMNNEIRMQVEFPITPDSSLLDWFKESHRRLEESEISAYGIQKNRYTYDQRNFFKILDWASGTSIHYQGGSRQQAMHSVMNSIVEHLKYQYQFSEE